MMDQLAAEEYHAVLLKYLKQPRRRVERLIWIPLFGMASYFASETLPIAVVGCLVGWAICAILSTLDSLETRVWHVEYIRHLYEYTDEADAGERRFNREVALENAIKKWWQF